MAESGGSLSLRTIGKHAAIYASGDIIAKIVGFALLPLYSRKFTTEQYGVLTLILLCNTIPSQFIVQGITHWAIKVMTLDYVDDEHRRRVAISTAHYYLIVSAVVVNGVLALCVPIGAEWIFKGDQYNHLLYCTFVISICSTMRWIPMYVVLRVRFRSALYSVLSFCEFLVDVSLNIYFVVYRNIGISGIVYSDLIISMSMAIVSWRILWPDLLPVFSRAEVKSMVAYGWPFIPIRLCRWLLDSGDRFQLQRFSTTAEVGLYSVGAKFASVFQFLYMNQFDRIWPSVLFPLSREKDGSKKFAQVLSQLFIAGCCLGLLVIIGVEPVIRATLPRDYWAANRVVPWLIGGFILEMVYQVFTAGLRISNKTKYMPLIVGAGAAFNLFANLWVLPRWGMVGAGFTTCAAFGLLAFLAFRFASRFYPFPCEWGRLVKTGASFLGIITIDRLVSPESLFVSVPLKVFEFVLFLVSLVLLGAIRAEEMRMIRSGASRSLRFVLGMLRGGSTIKGGGGVS